MASVPNITGVAAVLLAGHVALDPSGTLVTFVVVVTCLDVFSRVAGQLISPGDAQSTARYVTFSVIVVATRVTASLLAAMLVMVEVGLALSAQPVEKAV